MKYSDLLGNFWYFGKLVAEKRRFHCTNRLFQNTFSAWILFVFTYIDWDSFSWIQIISKIYQDQNELFTLLPVP